MFKLRRRAPRCWICNLLGMLPLLSALLRSTYCVIVAVRSTSATFAHAIHSTDFALLSVIYIPMSIPRPPPLPICPRTERFVPPPPIPLLARTPCNSPEPPPSPPPCASTRAHVQFSFPCHIRTPAEPVALSGSPFRRSLLRTPSVQQCLLAGRASGQGPARADAL